MIAPAAISPAQKWKSKANAINVMGKNSKFTLAAIICTRRDSGVDIVCAMPSSEAHSCI